MFKFVADSCLKHVEPYLDAQPSLEAEMKTKIRQRAQVSICCPPSSSSSICSADHADKIRQRPQLLHAMALKLGGMAFMSSLKMGHRDNLRRNAKLLLQHVTPAVAAPGGGAAGAGGGGPGTGKGTHQTPPFESDTPPEVGMPPVGTVFFFFCKKSSQKSIYCGFDKVLKSQYIVAL